MAGFSLHIGLNAVDPGHYAGWSGNLTACEKDMEDMAALSQRAGFSQRAVLRTAQATRAAIVEHLQTLALSASSGDLILVTYSGHGGQVPDLGGDEPTDGLDDTWCLYDGQFLDDELLLALTRFPAGCRILVVSDSCHSGGMEKFITPLWSETDNRPRPRITPPSIVRRTFELHEAFYTRIQQVTDAAFAEKGKRERESSVVAAVQLLAACREHELAYEDGENGMFTRALVDTWDFGRFAGNYRTFYQLVASNTPPPQIPQHRAFGRRDNGFLNQRPFQI